MEEYKISFEENNVFQYNLCIAKSAEQAKSYFESVEPAAKILEVRLTDKDDKPEVPKYTVPDGWLPESELPQTVKVCGFC